MSINKLKEFRTKKELTLGQLSVRTGMHKSYLSRIEHGLRTPPYEKMQKLARVLGCGVDDLFAEK